ncbi:hypothetical protein PINS_up010174 [Pythium insidiosum]|nr:hypothetical protein PINS_up010174 [Pythium insidiosum]
MADRSCSLSLCHCTSPLFEVHPQQGLVTPVDVLGYAYYGGLLCLGLKRFQDAIDLFLLAVTAPAVALSAFVVEAYKKLLLTSLVLRGEAPTLPKYTPYAVTRNVETHCAAYLELRRAFVVDRDVESVQRVLEAHAATFARDGNVGLVKQVVAALKHQKLLQLPRTYVTIALSEMARVPGLSTAGESSDADVDAEALLLQLIERGDVAAVVDKEKRMVTFRAGRRGGRHGEWRGAAAAGGGDGDAAARDGEDPARLCEAARDGRGDRDERQVPEPPDEGQGAAPPQSGRPRRHARLGGGSWLRSRLDGVIDDGFADRSRLSKTPNENHVYHNRSLRAMLFSEVALTIILILIWHFTRGLASSRTRTLVIRVRVACGSQLLLT